VKLEMTATSPSSIECKMVVRSTIRATAVQSNQKQRISHCRRQGISILQKSADHLHLEPEGFLHPEQGMGHHLMVSTATIPCSMSMKITWTPTTTTSHCGSGQ
jgi:hypothetical protein